MDKGDHPGWKAVAMLLGKEMEEKLAAIGSEEPEEIVRAFKSMQVCKELIERLKGQVLEFGFAGKEEEIYFFKEVKPAFQSKLLYFHKLFLLETGMPPGRKEQKDFLE